MHLLTSAISITLIFKGVLAQINIGYGGTGETLGAVSDSGVAGGGVSGLSTAIGSGTASGLGEEGTVSNSRGSIGSGVGNAQNIFEREFLYGKNRSLTRKYPGTGPHDEERTGLSGAVCRASDAGEIMIERIGDLQIFWQEEVKRFDRNIANFITHKIVFSAIDLFKMAYLTSIESVINAHILRDRIIIDSILLGYKIIRAPVREIFACR